MQLRQACAFATPDTVSFQTGIAAVGGTLYFTSELPLYSYDYDADPPGARAFKGSIAAADKVLFVTPEYDRSIPGVPVSR